MSDPWNAAWEEAEASPAPGYVVYHTLELQHPAFTEDGEEFPVRVVNGANEEVELGIEAGADFNAGENVMFEPVAFDADSPEIGQAKVPECKLTIDNVGELIMPYLEEAVGYKANMKVIYRQYRSDDPTVPCYGPTEFLMKIISASGTRLSGTARLEDLNNRKFPNLFYTIQKFPGLSNG